MLDPHYLSSPLDYLLREGQVLHLCNSLPPKPTTKQALQQCNHIAHTWKYVLNKWWMGLLCSDGTELVPVYQLSPVCPATLQAWGLVPVMKEHRVTTEKYLPTPLCPHMPWTMLFFFNKLLGPGHFVWGIE